MLRRAGEGAGFFRRVGFLKINETAVAAIDEARREFDATTLLEQGWKSDIRRDLRPVAAEWGEGEKQAYLEGFGRLAAGLASLNRSNPIDWKEGLAGECRRMAEQMGEHRSAGVKALLRAGALFFEYEANPHVHDSASEAYQKLIAEASGTHEAPSDGCAAEALTNPFCLGPGTEVVLADNEAGLTVEPIQELAGDGSGRVTVGGKSFSLDEFNAGLAEGRFMLKSGDNFFGGAELLRQRSQNPRFRVGQFSFYSVDGQRKPVEVVGTNQEQLEARYGQGYLPFVGRLPGLLTVDLKADDGTVYSGVDVMKYNSI